MSLTRLLSVMVLAVGVLLTASTVKADPIIFVANLTGSQEVPPRATSATGSATLILNDDGTATISLTFSGLSSNQVAAHIHRGELGVAGGIVIPRPSSGVRSFPLGNLTNFSLGQLTASEIADLKAGLWYVNVHTANFQAGEIRGQLIATPEPATLVLLGTGLLSVVGLTRRRKKQE